MTRWIPRRCVVCRVVAKGRPIFGRHYCAPCIAGCAAFMADLRKREDNAASLAVRV